LLLAMSLEETVKKIRALRPGTLHSRDDVAFVLSVVAPTGQERELKKQVVDSLFTTTSPQGFKTSDDLESYGEY
jgi:hemolysin-activating ACP:hemolysin acyltransferase